MSIQPGERESARFDVPPPDRDRGSGPTFGQALRRHWRVMVACVGGLALLAIAYSVVRTPNYSAETRLASTVSLTPGETRTLDLKLFTVQ